MAKAAKPKPSVKAKPSPKFTDKEQSERFVEAARKLGVESTSEFDVTTERILAKRPKAEPR